MSTGDKTAPARTELRIFQANVARTPGVHDLALAFARYVGADIILLQEP